MDDKPLLLPGIYEPLAMTEDYCVCPQCQQDIIIKDPEKNLGRDYICPKCYTLLRLNNDYARADDGDELVYYYLEKK